MWISILTGMKHLKKLSSVKPMKKPDQKQIQTVFQWLIKSDPSENHQNVVVRYIMFPNYYKVKKDLKLGRINTKTEERGGECNEVSEIKLYTEDEIKAMKSSDFAFGHKEMIEVVIDFIFVDREEL